MDSVNSGYDEEIQCQYAVPDAAVISQRAVKCGYLHKMGSNVQKWKRRFFVLRPMTLLYYYLSEYDTEPRGCIDMDVFSCVRRVESAEENRVRFELSFPGAEVGQGILLEARTEDDTKSWIKTLTHETFEVIKMERDLLKVQSDHFQSEIQALQGQVDQLEGYCSKFIKTEMALSQEARSKSELLHKLKNLEDCLRSGFAKLGVFCPASDQLSPEENLWGDTSGKTPAEAAAELGDKTGKLIATMIEMVERLINSSLEYQNEVKLRTSKCEALQQQLQQSKKKSEAIKIEVIKLENMVQRLSSDREEVWAQLQGTKRRERVMARELKRRRQQDAVVQQEGAAALPSRACCRCATNEDGWPRSTKNANKTKNSLEAFHLPSEYFSKAHADFLKDMEVECDLSSLSREIQDEIEKLLRSEGDEPLPKKLVHNIAQSTGEGGLARVVSEKTGGAGGVRSRTAPLLRTRPPTDTAGAASLGGKRAACPNANTTSEVATTSDHGDPLPDKHEAPPNTDGGGHQAEERPANQEHLVPDKLETGGSQSMAQSSLLDFHQNHISRNTGDVLNSSDIDGTTLAPVEKTSNGPDQEAESASENESDWEEDAVEYDITFESQTIGLQFSFVEGQMVVAGRRGYLYETEEKPHVGATLVAVNGNVLTGHSYSELVEILRSASRPMVCKFKEEDDDHKKGNVSKMGDTMENVLSKASIWGRKASDLKSSFQKKIW